MGTDKAWLEIGGVPMIERVISTVRPLASGMEVCLGEAIHPIDNRYLELASTFKAAVVFDRIPGCGPLGGILTALLEHTLPVLVVACDLPFITTEFIELLLKKHMEELPDITVACDADGRVHPLCAVYTRSCLPAVESNLSEGRFRVDLVFDRVRTLRLEYSEYEHLEGSARFLTNVNSQADYDLARRR